MRVFCVSKENQREFKKMNALEIEKRHIALARARMEKEIKLSLTSRLNNLEKRLANHEKISDKRLGDLRKLLKQRMEEFNSSIDLILEEKQRITESLKLELTKIDKNMRENSYRSRKSGV